MLENTGVTKPVSKTLPFFDKIFPDTNAMYARLAGNKDGSNKGHSTNAEAAELKYYTTTAMVNTVMVSRRIFLTSAVCYCSREGACMIG